MTTLTAGVILLRWQSLSTIVILLVSTLSIRFRRADYVGLAVISGDLGIVSACRFTVGLLDIAMADIVAIWRDIESVVTEKMNRTPSQWPVILT